MNGNHPIDVPIESIPSFTPQIRLPMAIQEYSPAESARSYAVGDTLYHQQPLQDLYTIPQAQSGLTPQEVQYLRTEIRARIEALSKQPNMGSSTPQQPGGLLSVLPQNTEAVLSSVPLSRTESCPLPCHAIEKGQMMRRQHSSVIPSSIPGPRLGYSTKTVAQSHAAIKPYNFSDAYISSTSTPNPYGAISSQFLPTVQHTSAPLTATVSNSPAGFSSSIAGYLHSRDDPFSTVRGNVCSKVFENSVNGGINPPEFLYNPHPDAQPQDGLLPQYSPQQLTFQNIPYTIDFNNVAFTAPRMEAQLSTSTFFDSVSTTLEFEGLEDLHTSGFPVKGTIGEELQFDFAAIDMSASQLTVRENQLVPVLPLKTLDIPVNHCLSTDSHLIPELTHTVETPSSPAQMSRQHSAATNHTNSHGIIPRSSGNMDSFTAPEMDRQWSDLSNPAIALSSQDTSGLTGDGHTRKRVRQPPPEDINLLLKGAGVGTDVSVDYYSTNPAIKDVCEGAGGLEAWVQVSLASTSPQALEDFVLEAKLRDANPNKLRKLDGQDVGAARAHAYTSQTRTTVQDPNSAFRGFVATTHPLPAFDQHLAMRRSETGPPLTTGIQPGAADPQQVITATTTTVNSVMELTRNSATNGLTGSRQRSGSGPISITSGNSLTTRTYVRRTQPRVFCDQCEEVPDGFRGDHELRRHKDRVHAPKKKVWVTKDISPTGDFFAGCKACKRGKHYFADYNAAAHLRRQHFARDGKWGRVRSARDEKKKANIEKVKSKLEKWGIDWREDGSEGGRGQASRAGEEFSLKFLRRWMKQIEIPQNLSEGLPTYYKEVVRPGSSDEEEEGNEEINEARKRNLQTNVDINTSATTDGIPESVIGEGQNPQPAKQSTFTAMYNLIDITPAANHPVSFLETQRELQALVAPVLERVESNLESFFSLQNGLG